MHHATRYVLAAGLLPLLYPACGIGGAAAPKADDAAYGIDKRVPWTTSRITGSLDPPAPYRIRRVFPNLRFKLPVDFTTVPGTDRLLIAELDGKVYTFPNDGEVARPDLFIDLADHIPDFRRLYGVAFHPRFGRAAGVQPASRRRKPAGTDPEANASGSPDTSGSGGSRRSTPATHRFVYLCYVMKEGDPKGTRVSRFLVKDADPPVLDPSTERVVIEWYAGGHNGGCLKFGPEDGYLYISTGDGTSPAPPDGFSTGQDISDLLGSILRIDVDRTEPGRAYRIPDGNPFVDLDGARPEVWAYGLRNPWRMSFDPETGWLWVGDVGWEMWEMVYRIRPGGNYGWSIVEGPQSVRTELEQGPTPILPPVAAHSHIESRSITGGYVYRGKKLKELRGVYVYGDYVTGKIWGLRYDGNEVTWQQELLDSPLAVIAFGLDHAGELYVIDYAGGIYELVPNETTRANEDFPRRLSETGLFRSVEEHEPAAGVIPYSINAEPWMDGAVARRYIAVPGAPKLEVWQEQNTQVGNIRGNWKYPTDTVFAKTLSLPMETGNPDSLRRIETQILHRDGDTWRAYTYLWNDEQTDAVLAPAEGLDKELTIVDAAAPGGRRTQTWHVSGRTECLVCHTTRGGSVYGFIPPQLNRDHDYGAVSDRSSAIPKSRAADGDVQQSSAPASPAAGGRSRVDNQLRTLVHIGLFDDPYAQTPENPEHRPRRIPDPLDESLDLEARARAYLYVNCSTCHRRGGGGTAKFELLYHKPLERLVLLDERPTQGTFKIHAARNVAPGDPYRSVLYYRMAALGPGHMPKIGSNVVDADGLRLLRRWIAGLDTENAGHSNGAPATSLRSQQQAAVQQLEREPPRLDAAIDQLLSTTSGALLLATALDSTRLSDAVKKRVIERGAGHEAAEVRALFERFLPEEQRIKRLGTVIEPEEILALRGDADRGRDVFFKIEGIACRNCHRINGRGRELGPDLDEIGKKYDRAQLLETILEPSKKIDKQYTTYLVQTSQGRVHTGLLVSRDGGEVVLKDNEAKVIRIPKDEVELMVPQRKSLMPDLLLRDMTARQVADLLEYLASLK